MKWMLSTAFVVIGVSAAATAQSGKDMTQPKMAEKMKRTYTGCIQDVNHGASFLLTHVAGDQQKMMQHDAMMKSDSDMAKKDEPQAMHGDHMMGSDVVLTGRSDLKKHVGQKVTVSGTLSDDMSDAMSKHRDTLSVDSLKVVSKSCS